jgi:hypothetical protein
MALDLIVDFGAIFACSPAAGAVWFLSVPPVQDARVKHATARAARAKLIILHPRSQSHRGQQRKAASQ